MLLAAAALGAIIGSFLNALSFRMGTGRSVMRGRSQCMRCGHALSALDLIPVVSWLWLGGRCRYCGARISWQYPLVEAAAAALGAGVYWLNPDPLVFAFWFFVWMVLLFAVVYDLRHYIIPWSVLFLTTLCGFAWVFFAQGSLGSWVAGPALAAPLLLISLVSRGRAMGWGDGGLELGLGWLLGPTLGLTAFVLAFWLGAAVGIVLILWTKGPASADARRGGYTMKSEVPFGPFLIAGAAAAYFFHVDLFATLPALFT